MKFAAGTAPILLCLVSACATVNLESATPLNAAEATQKYELLSFAGCGPPMPGGSVCNRDPVKEAPAIEALLQRCGINGSRALSVTDGWIGYEFAVIPHAVECVREGSPSRTQIRKSLDSRN